MASLSLHLNYEACDAGEEFQSDSHARNSNQYMYVGMLAHVLLIWDARTS